MKYEHIEYTEIENLLKQIDEIIDKEDKEAFYNWDEAYYGLYCKVNTMIQIAQDAKNNPEKILSAPHTTPVRKIDEVTAARHPDLKYTD